MVWLIEDVHKEFIVLKTVARMWLETKGLPDYKQYMFSLQLLGRKVSATGDLFPLQPSTIITRNSKTMCGKPLKAHSDKHLASEAKVNKLYVIFTSRIMKQ